MLTCSAFAAGRLCGQVPQYDSLLATTEAARGIGAQAALSLVQRTGTGLSPHHQSPLPDTESSQDGM